ncbi:MAG: HlyD family secretion protein [Azospirillum brasilense]|nr:MAG: HlyD family secretion protein [Azospirillum brasilense]
MVWAMLLAFVVLAAAYVLFVPGSDEKEAAPKEHNEAAASADYERGPHRGRMLRDGDFAVEVTIFEDGVPPEYRMYAYANDKPLPPQEVTLNLSQTRLDGDVDQFNFNAEGDYLRSDATVIEPHSFDVVVTAQYEGRPHEWKYASYEGRTKIDANAANAAGIRVEQAGPATVRETISLSGRIELNKNATTTVRARYAGVIREVKVEQGQQVKKGDVLVRIESNDSLQVYAMVAPISGVVLTRNATVGDMADTQDLFTISDLSQVWAELHVFPKYAGRVAAGQYVKVKGTGGAPESEGTIAAMLPGAESSTQTVVARVPLDNSNGQWRSGMTITGDVTVAQKDVPLAVKTAGLQRFRDFTVVFARVGDMYEVRMLELGQTDGEISEVLGGIKPGQEYVSENSFLIKADIEKSGASHDH